MMLYGRLIHLLPFLAVALLEACGGSATSPSMPNQLNAPGIAVGEPHPQPAPIVRDFELIYGGYTGVTVERKVVVRDADAFAKLWAEHASNTIPAAPQPEIDYKTKMVIAVYSGLLNNGCGGGISLNYVRDEGTKLVVSYDISVKQPPPGVACIQVMGSPGALAVVDRSDAPVEFVKEAPAVLEMTSIDQTNHSNVSTARTVVVKDEAAWVALWTEHNPSVKAPTVDFTRQMVVATFRGQQNGGCHAVTLTNALRVGNIVRVGRTLNVPGPLVLCTKDITTPAHIVTMEKTDDKVIFATQTVPL